HGPPGRRRPAPARRARPTWRSESRRLARAGRARRGPVGRGVEHIGSTAVPGLPARDGLDLQLAVEAPADADAVTGALAAVGLPVDDAAVDRAAGTVRVHRSADPGRAAVVAVRVQGSPAWRHAIERRDRLRADAAARSGYAGHKRAAAARHGDEPDPRHYRVYTASWAIDPDE
ncbi:GrpB family protein, partial [Pseudonocardia sp. ICBG1293]|uniref:GrpB family protein n=1 Tax=Pseudonocardia sp. ICBG1293 TaxID=2844382 RepID=UPI001CCE8CCE